MFRFIGLIPEMARFRYCELDWGKAAEVVWWNARVYDELGDRDGVLR